jgi:hypothetical protein
VLFREDFLWLETLLLLFTVAVARSSFGPKPPAWCAPLRRLSRRPLLACALPALTSVLLRLALLPWIPVPHPVVPDEFSHVLLAKTFLSGRLANPAHPLWQHFESIHVLSQPAYSSMYLAGQASFLAVGKLLAGDLFAGVLLGTMLFCAALTWFLRAYVPPGWALYGGMLAAVRMGAGSYWNNSYWGGSVPAFGAALALGAFPRLIRTWKPVPALAFTAGVIVLANTRPYESLGMLLVLGAVLAYRLTSVPVRQAALAFGLPCMLACLAFWGMTRQWQAVTGSPLTLPYQLNQRAYGWPMTLPWFHAPPVAYRHRELALYRDYEVTQHDLITKPSRIPLGLLLKAGYLWRFFFGVTLSATLLFAGSILRARRHRVLLLAGGLVGVSVLIAQSGYPHYLAPAAPIVALFLIQGLRHLMHSRMGPALVIGLLPIFAVLLVARVAFPPVTPNYYSWCCEDARQRDRNWVVERLSAQPGRQLVLVTNVMETYDTFEWVYNEPDPDASNIVFARDMGAARNEELLRYYRDRNVWRVLVKDHQATLSLVSSIAGAR